MAEITMINFVVHISHPYLKPAQALWPRCHVSKLRPDVACVSRLTTNQGAVNRCNESVLCVQTVITGKEKSFQQEEELFVLTTRGNWWKWELTLTEVRKWKHMQQEFRGKLWPIKQFHIHSFHRSTTRACTRSIMTSSSKMHGAFVWIHRPALNTPLLPHGLMKFHLQLTVSAALRGEINPSGPFPPLPQSNWPPSHLYHLGSGRD